MCVCALSQGPDDSRGCLNQSIDQKSSQSHTRARSSQSQHCHKGQQTLRREVTQAWGAEIPRVNSSSRFHCHRFRVCVHLFLQFVAMVSIVVSYAVMFRVSVRVNP